MTATLILIRIHQTSLDGWELGLTGWGLLLFLVVVAAVTR